MPDLWSVRRIGEYSVERITPAVYAIDDDQDESMYLVVGTQRAVMIDTGSNRAPVTPVIRAVWDGETSLVLTHAHFDHMYHSDEFTDISLHRDDIAAWRLLRPLVWAGSLGGGKLPKRYPVRRWHALGDGDTIGLGGRELQVIQAGGHTPGSIVLVDRTDRVIFTGDAFGSGDYAWMWMPGCACLSEYRASLSELVPRLEPYGDYRMLGGHRRQGMPATCGPDANPLTLEVARDMETLCGKILNGELKPVKEERIFGFRTATYRYRQAGIVITRGKIK